MIRTLIASGAGRYADPWHPFPRTSALIASTLEAAGFEVAIDDDVDVAMTQLHDYSLLIVNAGDPWRSGATTPPPAASLDGFDRALQRGIGILSLHCAVSSLRDYPQWHPTIGGMWVPTLSHHPPADSTEIMGVDNRERIVIDAFDVFDERYCRIQKLGASEPVAEHAGDHGREPTAWVRRVGSSRVAVDLLGHDERSYDSLGRRAMLTRLALWAASSNDAVTA